MEKQVNCLEWLYDLDDSICFRCVRREKCEEAEFGKGVFYWKVVSCPDFKEDKNLGSRKI